MGKLSQIIKESGNEIAMVRVDKTMKEMMGLNENVEGRWDAEYYHPKYDQYYELFAKSKEPVKRLAELKGFYITTGSGTKRIYTPQGGVQYIQNINIRNTGVDFDIRSIQIKEGSEIDRGATRVNVGDVLFNRSGEGTLGRSIYISFPLGDANISNDVYLIRNKEIAQAYLAIYLMTKIGQEFIERESHGVSGLTKINTSDIAKIPIPIISNKEQNLVTSEYEKMASYHKKAMLAKSSKNKAQYDEYIKTAEDKLSNLIVDTEAKIRGTR